MICETKEGKPSKSSNLCGSNPSSVKQVIKEKKEVSKNFKLKTLNFENIQIEFRVLILSKCFPIRLLF